MSHTKLKPRHERHHEESWLEELIELLFSHPRLHQHRCNPAYIVASVTIEGTPMPSPGKTDNLQVVARNAAGEVILPLPDAIVVGTKADDTVGDVNLADGTFTFTAGPTEGTDSLVATVAGIVSPAFTETVMDAVVASVSIVPAPVAAAKKA